MLITKASGLNDTIYGNSYAPVKQYLEDREQLHEGRSMLPTLFEIESTGNFAEKYASETTIDDFVPGGEAGTYPETEFQEGYSKVIYPFEWKQRFSISQTMIEDAKMGKIKRGANSFMSAFARTKEKFGADMYSKAIATTMVFGNETFDIAGADTKALLATDHPSKTGDYANQSNLYNCAFSYDNLTKLEAYASNFRDDKGNQLNINVDTIVIPFTSSADADQRQLIFETLNADGQPTTSDRAGNYHVGRWNVAIWPFLTAPSGMTGGASWFFLIDSDYLHDYACMVWLNRLDLSVKSYVDEETDNNIWKGRARFGGAPTDWRFIIGAIPGLGSAL